MFRFQAFVFRGVVNIVDGNRSSNVDGAHFIGKVPQLGLHGMGKCMNVR